MSNSASGSASFFFIRHGVLQRFADVGAAVSVFDRDDNERPLPAGVFCLAIAARLQIAAEVQRRHWYRRVNRRLHPFGNAVGAQSAALNFVFDITFDTRKANRDQFIVRPLFEVADSSSRWMRVQRQVTGIKPTRNLSAKS